MNVSPDAVRDALEHNSTVPHVQDLAGLLAYVYGRGHDYANRTSISDARIEIGDGTRLDPVLGPALARLLDLRDRVSGPEWSVADVDRVQWYRRRVESWDRSVLPHTGVGWPGGSAWIDLRITHMRNDGLTVPEISGVLRLSRRAIRSRIRRISGDFSWLIVCPCTALRAGE